MGLLINDKDVCPKCGAYWEFIGKESNKTWCSNGHPHPRDPNYKPVDIATLARRGIVRLDDPLDRGV